MKEILCKAIGVETYRDQYEELEKKYNELQEQLVACKRECESQKRINAALQVDFGRVQEDLHLLRTDADQYVEREVEKRILPLEVEIEKKMNHKWYGIGRQDAYAEMGIRNIEAHERGNVLVRTPDGDIVEMILGLEDVKADIDEAKAILDDEITIDDLADV